VTDTEYNALWERVSSRMRKGGVWVKALVDLIAEKCVREVELDRKRRGKKAKAKS